ncbi:MAG: acyl-CoA synthetase [Paraglaciecola sp.]|uniref:ApeI family dehydratase n=1 Tax=Paraglaciecola sp. TaxID=1920173 RepID=UPI003296D918
MSEDVYHGDILTKELAEDEVRLELNIPENLYYFRGHFPAASVLPGVALTHWVMEYLVEYFDVDPEQFIGLSALKFQIIIRPNYEISLHLKRINSSKYSFSYSSVHGQHASGKVLFK